MPFGLCLQLVMRMLPTLAFSVLDGVNRFGLTATLAPLKLSGTNPIFCRLSMILSTNSSLLYSLHFINDTLLIFNPFEIIDKKIIFDNHPTGFFESILDNNFQKFGIFASFLFAGSG